MGSRRGYHNPLRQVYATGWEATGEGIGTRYRESERGAKATFTRMGAAFLRCKTLRIGDQATYTYWIKGRAGWRSVERLDFYKTLENQRLTLGLRPISEEYKLQGAAT